MLGDLLAPVYSPAHRVSRLYVVAQFHGRSGVPTIGPRNVLVGNSASKHPTRHLDPMSHRGEDFSTGVCSTDFGRENLTSEVRKCLVRERLCGHRKPIRGTNSGARVQPGGVGIKERKRV